LNNACFSSLHIAHIPSGKCSLLAVIVLLTRLPIVIRVDLAQLLLLLLVGSVSFLLVDATISVFLLLLTCQLFLNCVEVWQCNVCLIPSPHG
jgi:hypothetical protein